MHPEWYKETFVKTSNGGISLPKCYCYFYYYIHYYYHNFQYYCYRLTITNPAINIPVPSVFHHEFKISRVGAPLFSGGTVYVLMGLYPESAACSCFRQQTGIPSHLFGVIVKICCGITLSWIRWFKVLKDNQLIHELLVYAKDVTNPAAKELISRINEDAVTEWLHAYDNVPTNSSSHWLWKFTCGCKSREKWQWSRKQWWKWVRCERERISIDRLSKNSNNFLLQYIYIIYRVRRQNVNNPKIF